jgi:hypothetical protein
MVSDNFAWQRAANDHSMRSGCHVRDCMVVRFTTVPSEPITTNVVNSNAAQIQT